jgi:hypothetical protein
MLVILDFSIKTMGVRRKGNDICKVLGLGEDSELGIRYMAKILIQIEGKINIFLDRQKLTVV